MRRVGQVRKRDANEAQIVIALEFWGVNVFRISGVGVPDLLTHWRGQWLPIEVKDPKGTLTPAQIKTQQRCPFPVVHSVDEALALFTRRA